MTAADLITDALREIKVVNAVDAPSGEDAALGLHRLNTILDNLNADGRAIYATTIETYTLTASLQPHTIGPSGATWTFAVARPNAIEAANLIISDVRYPIAVRDQAWWMGLTTPELSTEIPTDLYYEPAWPNGRIRFYPVPNTASEVELLLRVRLAELADDDDFTMPPGYRELITKLLALDLCAPFDVEIPSLLPRQVEDAKVRVFGTGVPVPRLCTTDAGMPGGGGSTWDYMTGMYR